MARIKSDQNGAHMRLLDIFIATAIWYSCACITMLMKHFVLKMGILFGCHLSSALEVIQDKKEKKTCAIKLLLLMSLRSLTRLSVFR